MALVTAPIASPASSATPQLPENPTVHVCSLQRVIVASGFMTAPGVSATNAGIEGGTVGPSGIAYGARKGRV